MAKLGQKINIAQATEMYLGGTSAVEIAKHFGMAKETVNRALRRHGVPVIRKTRAQRYAALSEETRQAILNAPKGHHAPEVVAARLEMRQLEIAQALARRIPDRSPCPYCGVRADYGCRHNRMAA